MIRAKTRKLIKKHAGKPWRPMSELDIERNNDCLVRCACDPPTVRHAYWGEYADLPGHGKARCWVADDGNIYALHDFAEFKCLSSLPLDKSDGALLRDRNLKPITSPVLQSRRPCSGGLH